MHGKGHHKSTPSSRDRAFQAPRHAARTGPPRRRLPHPPKTRLPPQPPPCLTSACRNLEVPEGLPRPESPRALARHPTASPVPPALLRGGARWKQPLPSSTTPCPMGTLPHGHPAPRAPCPTSTLPHGHPAHLQAPSGALPQQTPLQSISALGRDFQQTGNFLRAPLGAQGLGLEFRSTLIVRWGND